MSYCRIYEYLFGHVGRWVKDNYPEKQLNKLIGHYRFENRFIQISSASGDESIHYEYYQGHVELHFEDDTRRNQIRLINFLKRKTSLMRHLRWENLGWVIRCSHERLVQSPDELIETFNEMILFFDPLFQEFSNPQEVSSAIESLSAEDFISKSISGAVDLRDGVTVREILGLPLVIPNYQRIYCWEEENVKLLLEDIHKHITENLSNRRYRLGTIILHHHDDKFDIIDGQQRLVTLSLLLQQLGCTCSLLNEEFDSSEARNYIAYNKHLIRVFIENNEFNQLPKILDNLDFSIILLNNSSLDLAYTFFSNQNSRGVKLTDYDLLKAHHLRFIPASYEAQANRAATDWNKMIEEGRGKKDDANYIRTLDTYIYRLRRWTRKKECLMGNDSRRIKREYESAAIISELPAFGEKFEYKEPIQGGTHFFAYVNRYLELYHHFTETAPYKALHNDFLQGSTKAYHEAIEAVLFGYYIKFGEMCLSDALLVITRLILQHRYNNSSARKDSILRYVGETDLVIMLDHATSPTFFLAEAYNACKKLLNPYIIDLSRPIQRRMREFASNLSIALENTTVIESFKHLN